MSDPTISFEFFPPKSLDASFRLWDTAKELSPLNPSFVSVTYGAGGTTRKLTHEAVEALENRFDLNVAAHLTCVDATREETLEIADRYAEDNLRMNNILPGFIDSLPEKEEWRQKIPWQRYGTADEIAQTVAFLASHGSAYITCQNIRVDGGITRSV